jgi:hypothetical protein
MKLDHANRDHPAVAAAVAVAATVVAAAAVVVVTAVAVVVADVTAADVVKHRGDFAAARF